MSSLDEFDWFLVKFISVCVALFVVLACCIITHEATLKAECASKKCDPTLSTLYMTHEELCICATLPK